MIDFLQINIKSHNFIWKIVIYIWYSVTYSIYHPDYKLGMGSVKSQKKNIIRNFN